MITALLRDGREVSIAPECGQNVEDMVDRLTGEAFTGSGSPLENARLRTIEGEEVRYMDVQTFAETVDFLGGEAE